MKTATKPTTSTASTTSTTSTTSVTFRCRAPEAKTLCVAGDFNAWSTTAHPMKRIGDGSWSLSVDLPSGRHEFKFVVDGVWCCEPGGDDQGHTSHACEPNPFGTRNRIISVS